MTQLVNQFAMTKEKGMLDMTHNFNSIAVRPNEDVVAGQLVKIVDVADGIPNVVACDDTTVGFGFMNYNLRNSTIKSGVAGEMSLDKNVMFMIAGAAFAPYTDLMYVASTGKVITATGTTKFISGWALDKAAADGDIVRVMITCNAKRQPTA